MIFGVRAYQVGRDCDGTVIDKAKRLETANFERAEAAVRWEDADFTAGETGRSSDRIQAAEDDRALEAADRKIKKIEAEP